MLIISVSHRHGVTGSPHTSTARSLQFSLRSLFSWITFKSICHHPPISLPTKDPIFLLWTLQRAWHTEGPRGFLAAWMNESTLMVKKLVCNAFEQDWFPHSGLTADLRWCGQPERGWPKLKKRKRQLWEVVPLRTLRRERFTHFTHIIRLIVVEKQRVLSVEMRTGNVFASWEGIMGRDIGKA